MFYKTVTSVVDTWFTLNILYFEFTTNMYTVLNRWKNIKFYSPNKGATKVGSIALKVYFRQANLRLGHLT